MTFNFLQPFPQRWYRQRRQAVMQLWLAGAILVSICAVQILRLPSALSALELREREQLRAQLAHASLAHHPLQSFFNFLTHWHDVAQWPADTATLKAVTWADKQLELELQFTHREALAINATTFDIPLWQQTSVTIAPESGNTSAIRVIWTFHYVG
ncbi:hypothetical protein [Aliidiomarina indica]|uniref:hypothetical protein n=1 Tax=Aliidiomarina indica TaxID=2749147 RepID=UPI00188FFD41|nr:hypothetical protein [Aliidiomarina indica]